MLAREGHEHRSPAASAVRTRETPSQDPAAQVLLELLDHVARQRSQVRFARHREERLEPSLHHSVEHRVLGFVTRAYRLRRCGRSGTTSDAGRAMAPKPWRCVCQVRWFVISAAWARRWVAVGQRDSSHQGLARSPRAWIAGAALPSGDAPPECGGRHLASKSSTARSPASSQRTPHRGSPHLPLEAAPTLIRSEATDRGGNLCPRARWPLHRHPHRATGDHQDPRQSWACLESTPSSRTRSGPTTGLRPGAVRGVAAGRGGHQGVRCGQARRRIGASSLHAHSMNPS